MPAGADHPNAVAPSSPRRDSATEALLRSLIDYAGLFPPASLPMREVAENHAAYLASDDAWVLGRLIVPAARLSELAPMLPEGSQWSVSAIGGSDPVADARVIAAANEGGRLLVDAVEVRTPTISDIDRALDALPDSLTVYCEIPIAEDPASLVARLATAGGRAKVRTGGVTADAFPAASQVARFLARCADAGVAFKATAGLHHPVRGDYRLTYAPDADSGTMFGFLNVFLAAAFARRGMHQDELIALLQEADPSTMVATAEALSWRSAAVSIADVRATRESFAVAFGSCSFREPVDDLHAMGWL